MDDTNGTRYQAEVSWHGGSWQPVGSLISHRWIVEVNVDGYRDQAIRAGVINDCQFRIAEVTS